MGKCDLTVLHQLLVQCGQIVIQIKPKSGLKQVNRIFSQFFHQYPKNFFSFYVGQFSSGLSTLYYKLFVHNPWPLMGYFCFCLMTLKMLELRTEFLS